MWQPKSEIVNGNCCNFPCRFYRPESGQGSVISTATGLRAGRSRVRFRAGQEILFFFKTARVALGPTQPPVRWVRGPLSPVVKRPECEADFSPTFNAELKNEWSSTSAPNICLEGADRDNFTFIFSLVYQFSSCLFCALSIDISAICQDRDRTIVV